MVEIMMAAVAPRHQFQHKGASFGNDGLAMGEEAYRGGGAGTRLAEGEEQGWGVGDNPDNPAKCIMWCAIALGALMGGSPVEIVSRHHAGTKSSTIMFKCFPLKIWYMRRII